MSQESGRDSCVALAPYFRRQLEDGARRGFELAVREAFGVADELPSDLIELADCLDLSHAVVRR
jgi:hypothetical protein